MPKSFKNYPKQDWADKHAASPQYASRSWPSKEAAACGMDHGMIAYLLELMAGGEPVERISARTCVPVSTLLHLGGEA
jgi:hypothetical protein